MRGNPFTLNRSRDSVDPISIQTPKKLSLQKRGFQLATADLQGSNIRQQRFLCVMQQIVDQNDPSVAWVLNLTTQPGQKKRFLQIQSIKTLLLDYIGSDFPTSVNLFSPMLDGYTGSGNSVTHIIGTAFPSIGATVQKNSLSMSNIGYNSDIGGEMWDITGIPNLIFKVVVGNAPITMPTENPIYIKLKITRVII